MADSLVLGYSYILNVTQFSACPTNDTTVKPAYTIQAVVEPQEENRLRFYNRLVQ